jgi:hypothetical protein
MRLVSGIERRLAVGKDGLDLAEMNRVRLLWNDGSGAGV